MHVAEQIDQTPKHNEQGAKWNGVKKLHAAGHNVVRVNVSGYHPLRWDAPLPKKRAVTMRLGMFGDTFAIELEHPWHR